ncbi:MAG: thiamine phosphate synthase [Chitinivibrionales bacterium]
MQVKIPPIFGFYGILTGPVRGYEYLTEVLVAHEISFAQLRIKDAPSATVAPIARNMRRLTEGTKTKLIINDDPALAAEISADGVHIGQDDMPYRDARKIVGEKAIMGISTHSVKQVLQSCALCPDYIGVGPVFPTPTKKVPDPVIGVETMRAMLSATTLPAVAIGGITLENLPDVLRAGARNFCMVRQLNQSRKPEKVLQEILKIYRDFA